MATRWQSIKSLWDREHVWLWALPGLLLGLVIGFGLGTASPQSWQGVEAWLANNWFANGIWPEALSTMAAVVLLYKLDKLRDDQREKERLKNELLWQVRSQSNAIAVSAIDRLRHEGWLTGDTGMLQNVLLAKLQWEKAYLCEANLQHSNLGLTNLQAANLGHANLQGADMRRANLQAADVRHANLQGALGWETNLQAAFMWEANLQGADMVCANLQGAHLVSANLQAANLREANLQAASLWHANLQEANLWEANLQAADLMNANLCGVRYLEAAHFDEQTVLPDARRISESENGKPVYDKYWHKDVDWGRYTDPHHPDFWKPVPAKTKREQAA